MDLSELFSVKGKTVLITGGGQVRPSSCSGTRTPFLRGRVGV